MTDAVLLLPPSEGKAAGGDGPTWRATATGAGPIAGARAELVDAVRAALRDPTTVAGDVLRYGSDDANAAAAAADLAVDDAPTLPAVERYTGVVLEGLDRAGLSADARRRLDRATWFVSGMWGLVRATDPIPDYRLKVGAKVPGIGMVGTWWRPRLSPVVDDLVAGRLVWDLLPNEHARVWRRGGTAAAVASVEFRTAERGRRGVSNYHGKHLKGRFVRHLAATDPADLEAATAFAADGWTFDAGASELVGDAPRLVFTAPGS